MPPENQPEPNGQNPDTNQPAAGRPDAGKPGNSPAPTVRKPIAIGSQRDVANPNLIPSRPVQVERAAQRGAETTPAAPVPAAAPLSPLPHQPKVPVVPPEAHAETAPAIEPLPAQAPAEPAAPVAAVSSDAMAEPALPIDIPAARSTSHAAPGPGIPAPAVIRSRAGLGDDVEAEIAAVLGSVSMEDVVRQATVLPAEPEAGERIKATVTRIDQENVLVSLKGRFQGIVPLRQFQSPPVVGNMIEVIVKSQNPDDGLFDVAVPGAASDAGDWDSIQKDDIVDARVTGANTGGLEAAVGNLRGFIPASQIERFRVEQLGDYINQKLQCLVVEVNPERRKLVLSRRAILEREYEESRRKLMETLQPGVELEGIVTRLADFGAFVDIGGVEGLVHVSKLSWSRIKHPSEVVAVGQKVRVKVDRVEADTGRIGLSHRDTLERPWDTAAARFPAGATVKGTVSRIAQFGAFVRLDQGIEGLIHISELAHHRVFAVKNHVKEGQEVEVKVLSVDADAQKIALSLKALQTAPEKSSAKEPAEEPDTPRREAVVKGTGQPLQGGTTRRSDGDRFGLRL